MESQVTTERLATKHSRFRLLKKMSIRKKAVDKACKNSSQPVAHYNRMSGQDIHFSQQGGSQHEFLTYVAATIFKAASSHSLVDAQGKDQCTPTNPRRSSVPNARSWMSKKETTPSKVGSKMPGSQSNGPSSRTSSTRNRSACSCSSVSQSTKPSSASRRLSIYFLPPESLDLEELNCNLENQTPCYISRSPVSESDMEFFSFPPSSKSHGNHDGCTPELQNLTDLPASSSEEADQANSSQDNVIKSLSLATSSSLGNDLVRDSTKSCAQYYLELGIEAHEQDDLKRSAALFRRSATEGGGCGLGMLMWALSLRHGWGCQVDTKKAYWWLRLAAESLVKDLNGLQSKMKHIELPRTAYHNTNLDEAIEPSRIIDDLLKECKAIISELLLALYELGQCLMMGWGCDRDKQLAVQYYTVAAELGDPDAQLELGYCYETGKGVHKCFKQAAKYYRMACTQGVQMMGYQWIWKPKYNQCNGT